MNVFVRSVQSDKAPKALGRIPRRPSWEILSIFPDSWASILRQENWPARP